MQFNLFSLGRFELKKLCNADKILDENQNRGTQRGIQKEAKSVKVDQLPEGSWCKHLQYCTQSANCYVTTETNPVVGRSRRRMDVHGGPNPLISRQLLPLESAGDRQITNSSTIHFISFLAGVQGCYSRCRTQDTPLCVFTVKKISFLACLA